MKQIGIGIMALLMLSACSGGNDGKSNSDSMKLEHEIKKIDSNTNEMYQADTALEHANKQLDEALKNLKD